MMKYKGTTLILSDIHADIAALSVIFECIESPEFRSLFGGIMEVINLGDVVGRGYFPMEAIEFLRKLDFDLISILGNHDESVMFNWTVSGDDELAYSAHKELKQNRTALTFFSDLKDTVIEPELKLLCVHGGPVDPVSITPKELTDYEKWLYKRTWQRLDPSSSYFNPHTGFRYTPEMAFDHAKKMLTEETKNEPENILIFTGHQHREAIYRKKADGIANIHALIKSSKETVKCHDHLIDYSELVLEEDSSYLVRFGLAGPIGYHFYTSQFGILYQDIDSKQIRVALMEVEYQKEAQESLKALLGK